MVEHVSLRALVLPNETVMTQSKNISVIYLVLTNIACHDLQHKLEMTNILENYRVII